MIYVLRSNDLVKVGFTNSGIEDRLTAYRTHNLNFELICTYDGDMSLERVIHSKLSAHVYNSEWFYYFDGIFDLIDSIVSGSGCNSTASLPPVLIYPSVISIIDKNIGSSNCNYVLRLCLLVNGPMNVLSKEDGSAISTVDLKKILCLGNTRFYDLLRVLIDNNILFIHCSRFGQKQIKKILMNPYVCRKNKNIHRDCIVCFNDLSSPSGRLK